VVVASAIDVSHVLRGGGLDGDGAASSTGPAVRAAGLTAGGPAMDIPALFRQHYAELVRLAVMLVGDQPTAEDVVQEVFANLHARRNRPGPLGDPLAYVRACVLNGCRTVLRRRVLARRFGGDPGPLPDLPHESAEHEAIRAEGRRQVLAALATLPRRRREVLVLRYYLGLREAEIAAVLGITPGAVKSAASRGLGSLASALGEEK
jgi:RNA polymerase sigma-70 factor (sigma-E family)